MPPTTAEPANVDTAERRSPSSGGVSARIQIASRFSHDGALRSGKPWSTVWIAFAWISAPDISTSPEVEVAWTSCSVGAVPPTTTVAPRTTAGSNFPVSTCEKERNGTAPGGPAKSIQARFSGNVDGSSVCPSARSAATTGNVSSFVDLVWEPTDHAVGVGDVVAVGRPGAEHAQVAAEDVRAPVGFDLSGREHDLRVSLACVVDGRRRARHPRLRRAARRACRTPASASSAPCTECPRQ